MPHKFITRLLGTGAAGVLIGATLLAPSQAQAGFGGSVLLLISAVNAVKTEIASVSSQLGNEVASEFGYPTSGGGSIHTTLDKGFTQISEVMRGTVGANQQTTDAALNDQAVQARQYRDIHVRDQHILNPQACNALTNGQAIVVGAGQVPKVTEAIEYQTDQRSEGWPGTPSYDSATEGVASANVLHSDLFCSANDVAAHVRGCASVSAIPDGDQDASSLLGALTYANQTDVNAANAYNTTLLQPYVPAPLRGSALTSISGQYSVVERRQYNAQMSLARRVATAVLADHTQTVVLTPNEQQEEQALGMPVTQNASALQALTLDVDRRESSVTWHAALQADVNSKAVMVTVADELAQSNYIKLQQLQGQQHTEMLLAALLADKARELLPANTTMPTPVVASTGN